MNCISQNPTNHPKCTCLGEEPTLVRGCFGWLCKLVFMVLQGNNSCILQVADIQTQTLSLSSMLHHFICLETVLLDAQALITFNNNVLSLSSPSPSPKPNTSLPHRINFHAGKKSHVENRHLNLQALRPSSVRGGEGSGVPRGGLLLPRSIPSPAAEGERQAAATPTLATAGAVPARGAVALARCMVTAGTVQAVAGFPALQPIKSIRTGCGKQKRNPHKMPIQRAGNLPAEKRCLLVAFFADIMLHQRDSHLLMALPLAGQQNIGCLSIMDTQGTGQSCGAAGEQRHHVSVHQATEQVGARARTLHPDTPWRGRSKTLCATCVQTWATKAAVHLLLVYILLVFFFFLDLFPSELKPET